MHCDFYALAFEELLLLFNTSIEKVDIMWRYCLVQSGKDYNEGERRGM